jgi:hypothetical protein
LKWQYDMVHLSKLAVGCDSIATLSARQQPWIITRADGRKVYRHRTRFLPKRDAELKNGGSMYWIVKTAFMARQEILDFECVTDGDKGFTLIHLNPVIVPVMPTPRRLHQGWRYLEAADAPPDMTGSGLHGIETLPPKLLAELRGLGLM